MRSMWFPLRYFALNYINNRSILSDIVQDAFVRLWEKIQQFKDENEAKAFLYKVVQNACIDLIRHQEVAQKSLNTLSPKIRKRNHFWIICWNPKYSKPYAPYLMNSHPLVKKCIYSACRGKAMKKFLYK